MKNKLDTEALHNSVWELCVAVDLSAEQIADLALEIVWSAYNTIGGPSHDELVRIDKKLRKFAKKSAKQAKKFAQEIAKKIAGQLDGM